MAARHHPNDLFTPLNGVPTALGVIVATTTKSNHDTAAPFNNTGDALKCKVLLLQPDTACWIAFGTTNAVTASTVATAGSIYLAARQLLPIVMTERHGWIACVAVSGTTNLQVWELS